jgi:hypothetical protein
LKNRALVGANMAQEGVDTERTSVKTYIPVYQREEWERHADQLDMSRSEFIRTMVQAGRRSFDGQQSSSDEPATDGADAVQAGPAQELTDQHELDELIVETLSVGESLSWDELLAALTDDIEDRLEASLQRLQQDNVVQYSGRDGGYTLLDDDGD